MIFTHVRTRAYTNCPQLKNFQAFIAISENLSIYGIQHLHAICFYNKHTLVLCILSIILNVYKYIFYV